MTWCLRGRRGVLFISLLQTAGPLPRRLQRKGVQRGWLREVKPLLVPLHLAEPPLPALYSSCPSLAWGQWILPGTPAMLAFSIFYLDKDGSEVGGGGKASLSLPFPSFRAWWALSSHWKAKSSGKSEKVGCCKGREPAAALPQGRPVSRVE